MKHINFLETSSIAQSQIEANYLVVGLISAVTAAVFLGLIFWQNHSLGVLQTQLDAVTAISQPMKKPELALKAKLNNPILWAHLLREIGQKMPTSMHLLQLTGALTGTRVVALKGYASNSQSIFWLKNNLASLPECGKATVATFGQANFEKSDQSIFQLECKLR